MENAASVEPVLLLTGIFDYRWDLTNSLKYVLQLISFLGGL